MECKLKNQATLLSLAAVVMLLCISCQKKPQPKDPTAARNTFSDKCKIDLASPQPCTLSKFWDERVVWVNNSSAEVYVCADPHNDPFEAYGWLVPPMDKRKSGAIWPGVNPPTGGTLSFDFYTSKTFCVWPPPDETRTNPKIIIGN
jgi:hypothetical protein